MAGPSPGSPPRRDIRPSTGPGPGQPGTGSGPDVPEHSAMDNQPSGDHHPQRSRAHPQRTSRPGGQRGMGINPQRPNRNPRPTPARRPANPTTNTDRSADRSGYLTRNADRSADRSGYLS